MNKQIDALKEEVKGLRGVSKSNPHSPSCICDGCRYSGVCYGGCVGGQFDSNFCFIDIIQGMGCGQCDS